MGRQERWHNLIWNLQKTRLIKMFYNITNRTHLKFITAWNTCYCWLCGLSFTLMLVIFTENYAITNSQRIMKPNTVYHSILLFVYSFHNLLPNIWYFSLQTGFRTSYFDDFTTLPSIEEDSISLWLFCTTALPNCGPVRLETCRSFVKW